MKFCVIRTRRRRHVVFTFIAACVCLEEIGHAVPLKSTGSGAVLSKAFVVRSGLITT